MGPSHYQMFNTGHTVVESTLFEYNNKHYFTVFYNVKFLYFNANLTCFWMLKTLKKGGFGGGGGNPNVSRLTKKPEDFTLNSPRVVQFRLMEKEFKLSITEFNVAFGFINEEYASNDEYLNSACDYIAHSKPVSLYKALSTSNHYDPNATIGLTLFGDNGFSLERGRCVPFP
ncbi:Uncharacterized protein Fot_04025 [Forsythia ovata]|uniref:Uncharacterized protein n=1 Tax=Forsythia ovata TaxID=205694 RepID=A0ABD1XBD7_9LAMI